MNLVSMLWKNEPEENKINPIPIIIRLNTNDKETRASWFKLVCPRYHLNTTDKFNTGEQEPHLIEADREPGKPQRTLLALNPAKSLYTNLVQRYLRGKALIGRKAKIRNPIIKDTDIYCPGDCNICKGADVLGLSNTALSFRTGDIIADDIRKRDIHCLS